MSTERLLKAIDAKLGSIETRLSDHHRHLLAILQNQETIMSKIDDLNAAVTRNTDAEDSVITLLNGISQQLKDANTANDPKIQAVIDQLDANTAKAAAAVVASTPAA